MAETGIPVTVPILSTAGSVSVPIIASVLAAGPATWGALAIPVIGAAIAGVSLAVGLWLNRKEPKQAEAATKVVNEAEGFLKQYKAAWDSSNKTQQEKDLYLEDFWKIWSQVVEACSNDAYGDPGHSCIQDRMPMGMSITARNGKTYVGNGMWNWFAYYFDPVNNYQPPQTSIGEGIFNIFGGIGNGSSMVILAGLFILGGAWYFMGDNN